MDGAGAWLSPPPLAHRTLRRTTMAMTEQISSIDAVSSTETAASISSSIKTFARHAREWIDSCADYYAAAAMYEQLSKLSNAELNRRGLSRDTLAQDVFRSCDRRAHG
jgi:hypothetical protein